MNARPPVPLARSLPDFVWIAFLVWTAIGFVVMPLGVGDARVHAWLGHGSASDLLSGLLHRADAIWIILAAANIYLHAARAEGLATTRLWAGIILVSSTVFEWIGTATGSPFGPYLYTDNFGWRIAGVVPLAIPLAWFVVVVSGRYSVGWLRPAATRLETALGVAVVATLTDLNLEYVAWKVRAYWVWYPHATAQATPAWPPWQNFASWFVLSGVLAYVLPPNYELRLDRPSPRRPVLVLALMNALLAFVHLTKVLSS